MERSLLLQFVPRTWITLDSDASWYLLRCSVRYSTISYYYTACRVVKHFNQWRIYNKSRLYKTIPGFKILLFISKNKVNYIFDIMAFTTFGQILNDSVLPCVSLIFNDELIAKWILKIKMGLFKLATSWFA